MHNTTMESVRPVKPATPYLGGKARLNVWTDKRLHGAATSKVAPQSFRLHGQQ